MQFKTSRRKKTVIIVAAVIGLIAIVILSKAVQKKEGEPVQVGKVERHTRLESKVTASGDIRPVHLYNLTAEVPGRVEQIYVSEGDPVKKGQPLVAGGERPDRPWAFARRWVLECERWIGNQILPQVRTADVRVDLGDHVAQHHAVGHQDLDLGPEHDVPQPFEQQLQGVSDDVAVRAAPGLWALVQDVGGVLRRSGPRSRA